ncbi:hypothetical protein ACTNBL_00915 [Enterococcus villorum]|uniref:Uncharacterized protein n=2 Tax=Enterococcus villorum TaxID=112904 RepID=A0A511J1G3_9ENTE|nr:hypothetical protein [Enterococcus villorum]EOH91408.1 hypothetical protein UAO_00741 [Enterococcus villorum ATCC 700913]EOW76786.1 hypothetical protein I591_02094 [Enterococcus villorum ATCC 700913]GEL91824.1 hypothetical protein EVI01_11610 [Enterococcus villorum]
MDNLKPTTSKIETQHVMSIEKRPNHFIELDIMGINETKKILGNSYYQNESEHYFEILAMTLGLVVSGNFALLNTVQKILNYLYLKKTKTWHSVVLHKREKVQ